MEDILQAWYIFVPVLVVAIAAATFLIIRRDKSKQKAKWPVRDLAVASLCVALSFILSFIKIIPMPQGGSLTPASMLPIMAFSYMYGFRKGLLACIVYGLLQMIQDPFFVHWAQIILDYMLAFMCLSLTGVFRRGELKLGKKGFSFNTIYPGIIIATAGRYLCSVVSGAVFFAEYATPGMNVWVYSFGYNSVILLDGALGLVFMLIPQLRKLVYSRRLAMRGA